MVAWRLRHILGNNGAAIQAYDQNVWAETFDYARRDAKESLEFFQVLRARNLAMLKAVPKELWENYGLHQERGQESIADIVRMSLRRIQSWALELTRTTGVRKSANTARMDACATASN